MAICRWENARYVWNTPRMHLTLAVSPTSVERSTVASISYGKILWFAGAYRGPTCMMQTIATKRSERFGVDLLLVVFEIRLRPHLLAVLLHISH